MRTKKPAARLDFRLGVWRWLAMNCEPTRVGAVAIVKHGHYGTGMHGVGTVMGIAIISAFL